MAQQSSFSSNNPFRRKAAAPSVPTPPTAHLQFAADEDAPGPSPEVAPADRFRSQLQALSTSNQPPPSTSFQKPKVIKRVRVQSPPPSSPESSGQPDDYRPVGLNGDGSSSSNNADDRVDPFTIASSTASADLSDDGDEPQPTVSHRPPPNPFQRTLRDLEVMTTESEWSSGTEPGTRGALDVGAFGRLLLTGQVGDSGTPQAAPSYLPPARHSQPPTGDGASTTDKSSISRQSMSDSSHAMQETLRSSRESSEHEAEDDRSGLIRSAPLSLQPAPSILKKKPPPPSSRHGKRINHGAGGEPSGEEAGAKPPLSSPPRRAATIPLTPPTRQRPPTPSDVNKPLPPAPHKSPAEEAAESVFDREAAGKVPEPEIEPGLNIIMPPRPPTPPNAPHTAAGTPTAAPQQLPSRKPAPPPRRQPHGRTDSKVNLSPVSTVQPDDADSSNRRSSLDSTRSRSSSLRASVHAPGPPPPRRPGHPSRASSSHTSPSSAPSSGAVSPGNEQPQSTVSDPSSRPGPIVTSPPPIADHNPSSSSGSIAPVPPANAGLNHFPASSLQQQIHRKRSSPPPPPPARNASVRGKRPVSSKVASPDASLLLARRSSGGKSSASGGKQGSTPPPPPPPPPHRERDKVLDAHGFPTVDAKEEPSPGCDLLADLSALQREVDALRGRYESAERAEQGLGSGGHTESW